jgi:hypothetical protein
MLIRIILFTLAVTAMTVFGPSVHAQQNSQSAFWNNYWAARGGYGGDNTAAIIANQRNTEALINEMRAQRGLPPCSIGLLGQWQGRPPC